MLPDLRTDFSRGRSGGLKILFKNLPVCGDPYVTVAKCHNCVGWCSPSLLGPLLILSIWKLMFFSSDKNSLITFEYFFLFSFFFLKLCQCLFSSSDFFPVFFSFLCLFTVLYGRFSWPELSTVQFFFSFLLSYFSFHKFIFVLWMFLNFLNSLLFFSYIQNIISI